LAFDSRRTPARGYNVAACKPGRTRQRIVVTAHIDTKPGTPGAIDNASGCVVLTLLAELLRNYSGERGIELVAFNGEDYYSAPGEVLYMDKNRNRMDDIFLNINIDGVGFSEGDTAFSMYNCPDNMGAAIKRTLAMHPGIVEGPQWFQGDHMVFVMQQKPALAFTSEQAVRLMMEVVHSADDRPEIVDPYRLAALAVAIEALIKGL
jgi:aminopeptidase YwaD